MTHTLCYKLAERAITLSCSDPHITVKHLNFVNTYFLHKFTRGVRPLGVGQSATMTLIHVANLQNLSSAGYYKLTERVITLSVTPILGYKWTGRCRV